MFAHSLQPLCLRPGLQAPLICCSNRSVLNWSVLREHMGCGASSANAIDNSGLAILGKQGQKIDFPDGVVCERIRASDFSKSWTIKRLKTFTPTALVPLLAAKDATAVHEQLKDEMIEKCFGIKLESTGGLISESGSSMKWNRPALHELLKTKYVSLFREKGLLVSLCYTEWMVFFNETPIQETRLWLEFVDLTKYPSGWQSVTPNVPGTNEYDPHMSIYDWEADLQAFLLSNKSSETTNRSTARNAQDSATEQSSLLSADSAF
jgi:hypothetical protein